MSVQVASIVHAMARFDADAVAPAFLVNRGFAAAITRNGAGDYTLTFLDEVGTGGTGSVVQINALVPMVASGLTTFGFTRPNAATIRITSLQEAAMGGASVLTDVDFNIIVFRTPISN